jgi:hypothetical protein
MTDYNKLVGYDVYAGIRDSSALEKVGEWCATYHKGVICGSAAVAIHLGKEVRPVTPDLDVLISRDESTIASVLAAFGKKGLAKNRFGFSNVVDNMDTDWLIAKDRWQVAAITKPVMWKGLAVMALPFLIISKLVSGRDKDANDLQLIFNHKGQSYFDKSIMFMRQLGMDKEIEDLQSDMHIFKLVKPD